MPEGIRSSIPLKVVAAGATDIGRHRKHNEDAVLVRHDLRLYLLADGAGGHNAGNVASAIATTSIANYLEANARAAAQLPEVDRFGLPTAARRLGTAIQHANRDIMEIANSSNKRKGMGSTIVAAMFSEDGGVLYVAHVGDSRCYRLRDGMFEQLTHDHSLLNDVLALHPDLDDAQLAKLPRRVVTRALGMEDPVRVSIRTFATLAGDRYLLCSDGLTDALYEDQLADILRVPAPCEDQVKMLLELANQSDASDNLAAIVVACEATPGVTFTPRRLSSPPERPLKTKSFGTNSGPAENPTAEPPEIIIAPDSNDEDQPDSVHVVPPESADDDLLAVLGDFWENARQGRTQD